MVHIMLVNNMHFIPESVAIMVLGMLIGLIIKLSNYDRHLLASAKGFL